MTTLINSDRYILISTLLQLTYVNICLMSNVMTASAVILKIPATGSTREYENDIRCLAYEGDICNDKHDF